MVVAESRRQRRIVGRFDRGADLVSSVLEVCAKYGVRAGEVRALGSLEALEICEFDQSAKAYRAARRFSCSFEILSFTGNVTEKDGQRMLHAHVTVSRERDNGIEVLGGHLLSARVFSCEFVIEAWDDLLLRRGFDASTGLSLWQEAFQEVIPVDSRSVASQPKVSTPPPYTPKVSTPPPHSPEVSTPSAQVVEIEPDAELFSTPLVVESSADDEEELPAIPSTGDVLDHPTFGKATVERIEGEGEFVQVRLRSGRLIRLSLEVLDLREMGEAQGHRIFQATVRR